jgi:hypothetical protein
VISRNQPDPVAVQELAQRPTTLLRTGNIIGGPSATLFRRDDGVRFDTALQWLVDMDFYLSYLERSPTPTYVDRVLVGTTTNSAHQVTARSSGNPSVEIAEWDHVYRKHLPRSRIRRLQKIRALARRYGTGGDESPAIRSLSFASATAARTGAAEGAVLTRVAELLPRRQR